MKLNNIRKIEIIKSRILGWIVCRKKNKISGQNSEINPEVIIKEIINKAALQSALCGAISGQVGIVGIILDIIPVIEIQSDLVREIAGVCGKDTEILSEDTGLLIKLSGISLGIRSGIKIGELTSLRVLQSSLAEEGTVVGVKGLAFLIGRKMLVSIPIISSITYSVMNYITTRNIGLYYWKKLSHLKV